SIRPRRGADDHAIVEHLYFAVAPVPERGVAHHAHDEPVVRHSIGPRRGLDMKSDEQHADEDARSPAAPGGSKDVGAISKRSNSLVRVPLATFVVSAAERDLIVPVLYAIIVIFVAPLRR